VVLMVIPFVRRDGRSGSFRRGGRGVELPLAASL
jgi:hypothetical protein